MKRGLFFSILFYLFIGLLSSSCDDSMTKVGSSLLQPEDYITVYTDTFQMKASTIQLDSIYAKTTNFLLGEMYDPVYGIIKSDFLCQFYCQEDFQFNSIPINNKIDSVELIIYYHMNSNGGLAVYGDTLTPMQVTVYPINKPLKRYFYSNDQPESYCDMQNPLASASYTLFDLTESDSLRQTSDYMPKIRIKLPTEFGQKIYDESVNNPSTFKNQISFNEFFPGVYITTTYGSGCLLPSSGDYVGIRLFYTITTEPDINTGATTAANGQWFYSSKDVVQINRLKNSNIDPLLEENPTHTYVKAPAGVCTKLVLPTTEIAKEIDIKDRFINGFSLNLKYLPEDERIFMYSPPEYLLLLPEDSVQSFFETGKIEDNITSFISFGPDDGTNYYNSASATYFGYSPYTRTYSFGNISNLLKEHIDKSPEKDLSLLVIPVTRKYSYYSSYGIYYTTAISHSFSLSGVKIRTEEEFMKVIVLSSKYEL